MRSPSYGQDPVSRVMGKSFEAQAAKPTPKACDRTTAGGAIQTACRGREIGLIGKSPQTVRCNRTTRPWQTC
eukprot:10867680-Lingulodinium_polyedra.AAC.1